MPPRMDFRDSKANTDDEKLKKSTEKLFTKKKHEDNENTDSESSRSSEKPIKSLNHTSKVFNL